ncbi:ROK family transcriptional regulator [Streptomyces sp. OR43]|uniref:ROK family transcriptional regulator n=1 Tax=Streptomyces sp. or43 TaxID=2478957 RepID=UPI0011CDB80B|nr:ROK family transcriptional regulator [Streptomyces sp. or43]TXS39099.1 ROK family transcriptional regulator [Streptomyces sp. or43]
METSPTPDVLQPRERHIVAAVRDHGGANRRELAELTGLPRTTVTATVSSLIARGLLTESDGQAGTRRVGRPSPTVHIELATRTVAAVELGRRRQSVTLIGFDGRVRNRADIELDQAQPFEAVAAALAAAADSVSSGTAEISAMVVSVAMPFRRGAGAPQVPMYSAGEAPFARVHARRPGWLITDPSAALTEALGVPVAIENDINLAALGESGHGVAKGAHTAVYLGVVPGFGAGIVIHGRLYRGAGGVAGELAHISVREDGDLCVCGNRGCYATVRCNGPSLGDDIATALGRDVSLDELIGLAARGDVIVCRWLTDLGRSMGRPLTGFVTMLNPDLLVVDSGLGAAAAPVVEGLRDTIERRTSPMTFQGLDIRAGQLAEAAVPAGAAVLAAQNYVDRLLGLNASPRPGDAGAVR